MKLSLIIAAVAFVLAIVASALGIDHKVFDNETQAVLWVLLFVSVGQLAKMF